jgi:hypothetical protein
MAEREAELKPSGQERLARLGKCITSGACIGALLAVLPDLSSGNFDVEVLGLVFGGALFGALLGWLFAVTRDRR